MADPAKGTWPSDFTVDQLDYSLPEELIAQHPPARREDARLLIVDRASAVLCDSRITEFPSLLRPGDLLVLNDTKVVPAKFLARRKTGGKVPGLFLEEIGTGIWEVLLEGSRRLKVGEGLAFVSQTAIEMEILERLPQGRWRVRVNDPRPADEILEGVGQTPLPPYISRQMGARDGIADRERYQTVYAHKPGAVAAPTAGLHLTERLLHQLGECGVEVATVTLHVGLSTFKPIAAERLSDHVMHVERYEVSPAALEAIRLCRARGSRIVAVGTTTVRVLETLAASSANPSIDNRQSTIDNGDPLRGATNIFIHPPYQFRLVDALLTNFHLPRSTLLALVMAFAGTDLTRRAYQHAIAEKYRFYSYGDAMLIL